MKDFDLDDSPAPDPRDKGPDFILGGQHFDTLPIVPGGLVGDVVLSFTRGPGGESLRDVARCLAVIRELLITRRWVEDEVAPEGEKPGGQWVDADDVQRFDHVISSKEVLIPAQKIVNVFDWMMSEYAGMNARPT